MNTLIPRYANPPAPRSPSQTLALQSPMNRMDYLMPEAVFKKVWGWLKE